MMRSLRQPSSLTPAVRGTLGGVLHDVITLPKELYVFQNYMCVSDKVDPQFFIETRNRKMVVDTSKAVFFKTCFLAFITIFPGTGKIIIGKRMNEFHAAPIPVRPLRPIAAYLVVNFISQISVAVFEP